MQEDFKYQGKVYYFKQVSELCACDGCAFDNDLQHMYPSPCTLSEAVKDCWEDIIWIEKK